MSSRLTLRLVAFVAIAVHMQAGPVAVQVLGLERPPTTMIWRMYAAVGRNLCETSWFLVEGGEQEPLDRLALLGYSSLDSAPGAVKRLHGPRSVRSAAAEVCGKLPGREVRVDARCGSHPYGVWRRPIPPDQNLCEALPARRPGAEAPGRQP